MQFLHGLGTIPSRKTRLYFFPPLLLRYTGLKNSSGAYQPREANGRALCRSIVSMGGTEGHFMGPFASSSSFGVWPFWESNHQKNTRNREDGKTRLQLSFPNFPRIETHWNIRIPDFLPNSKELRYLNTQRLGES